MPLLFARFALSIFKSAAPFVSAGEQQECKVRVFDPTTSKYRVQTMTRVQMTAHRSQSRSVSPRKRGKIAGEDLDISDGDRGVAAVGVKRVKRVEQLTDGLTTEREVSLPPNVSIYAGPSSARLLRASIFTRLVTTVPDPAKLAAALGSDCATFCHQYQNVVLIFDEDLDTHHEHFRQVCLHLKDNGDLGLDYGRCIFDVGSYLHAGFQMDKLQGGAIMVVDLQDRDDDDREDDSDAEDDASLLAALGEPVGGAVASESSQA
ncbi:hypothetical protein F4679DRAFT_589759 [Xylaria curta]|nr:hypothetical protein F4679DRAFT_589759 [Xylaria curta]